jgi:thiol-disulfide isomerase/thioredoxin
MKPYFYLFFAFCLLFPGRGYTQYKIEGSISNYANQKITLLRFFGDSHTFADSLTTDEKGGFSFELDDESETGLYSIALGNQPVFNVLYNKENIIVKYEAGSFKVPEIIFSLENLLYYDYLLRSDRYEQKNSLIKEVLRYYPEEDNYYISSTKQFQELQYEFREYTDKIIKDHPNTLVSRIIASDRPILIPAGFNWDHYLEFNKLHYLDETDFADSLLINTNVLTSNVINYLGLYSSSTMSKEVQEKYFIQAVDTVLHRAMENSKVYDFIMQYLIEGFEMYGFETVIAHIAENYEPANTCVNENRKSELQKRVENLRRMAVGMEAPDIIIEGPDGESFSIADLNSDKVLIVFWASWCPHCNAMLPSLQQLYNDPSTDFEVIAISLDTSAADYNQALSEHALKWINYSDFKGWDSKAAIDYSIYATPSMFLLSSDRKILARPVSVYELEKALLKH